MHKHTTSIHTFLLLNRSIQPSSSSVHHISMKCRSNCQDRSQWRSVPPPTQPCSGVRTSWSHSEVFSISSRDSSHQVDLYRSLVMKQGSSSLWKQLIDQQCVLMNQEKIIYPHKHLPTLTTLPEVNANTREECITAQVTVLVCFCYTNSI